MAEKLASGEGFTLEDFVEQLAMVRKLGPIGNVLGHAARGGAEPGDAQPDRRQGPGPGGGHRELDDASRSAGTRRSSTARGGRGSRRVGRQVGEVNSLITRFLEGQKMMRQMMGMPGMRRGAQKAARKGKKKSKGGRPGGGAGSRAAGRRGRAVRAAGRDAQGPGGPGGRVPWACRKGSAGTRGSGCRPVSATPPPNVPPGLRGPAAGRRGSGQKGVKGRRAVKAENGVRAGDGAGERSWRLRSPRLAEYDRDGSCAGPSLAR